MRWLRRTIADAGFRSNGREEPLAVTRRSWPQYFALWVLLASIFAHALVPTSPSLAKRPGSAFRADTVDVSLRPNKATAVAKHELESVSRADDTPFEMAATDSGALIAAFQLAPPQRLHDAVPSGLPIARADRQRVPYGARGPPSLNS